MLELRKEVFDCITSYALDSVAAVNVDNIKPFYKNLPLDPYIKDNYRFRRLSHFKVAEEGLVKLPHRALYQAKKYNPLLGNVVREFAELEDELIKIEDFQRIVLEFFEFCKICSIHTEVAVHQIRTVAYPGKVGNPAPEGIHRDGVDMIGIFAVNREGIEGGETHLYKSKSDNPIFTKILHPGELLVFSDRNLFHFTTAIEALTAENGVRDVFVITCPGLNPQDNKGD
ncbi:MULTISPECIES: 2OG-Fe dioxygenase family protein [Nostocales]|uniref:2OG-Fe dioxygenase family protein n=3 Tax=Nostocales TaxID=1161 RepID=A0A0C1NH27_9CYAN|nr:2OG-Fe dioxygenase family protein [Tolypothrix bouteillei]KAF3890548.1 2OG-Fe dioxygenase family protein [Tolypothrix bouteillei VB521301]